jgi:hypothetical protein
MCPRHRISPSLRVKLYRCVTDNGDAIRWVYALDSKFASMTSFSEALSQVIVNTECVIPKESVILTSIEAKYSLEWIGSFNSIRSKIVELCTQSSSIQ